MSAITAVLDAHASDPRGHLRSGEDVAFVAVHALRGLLVATAAHAPGKLRSGPFRAEVTRLLERHLAR